MEELANKINDLVLRLDAFEDRLNYLEGVTTKPDNELILAQANELVIASGKKVATEVYSKIVSHINTEVSPKVNAIIDKINFATENGDEVIDTYRTAVQVRSEVTESKVAGLIGMSDSQKDSAPVYISPYVSIGLKPR
jgi:hypothetical protein